MKDFSTFLFSFSFPLSRLNLLLSFLLFLSASPLYLSPHRATPPLINHIVDQQFPYHPLCSPPLTQLNRELFFSANCLLFLHLVFRWLTVHVRLFTAILGSNIVSLRFKVFQTTSKYHLSLFDWEKLNLSPSSRHNQNKPFPPSFRAMHGHYGHQNYLFWHVSILHFQNLLPIDWEQPWNWVVLALNNSISE